MTTPRKHEHAEMIRQWLADDSLKVEYFDDQLGIWSAVENRNPSWYEHANYRFKTKMIKCGDLEFPEPMRVAPEVGDDYWRVCLDYDIYAKKYTWSDCDWDKVALKRGIYHKTKEAAEAHARALIALTEVRE